MSKYSKKGWDKKKEEIAVMKEFWDESADINGIRRCAEALINPEHKCNIPIHFDPKCIMHVYGKGAHCISRTDKRNLKLVCFKVHDIYDCRTNAETLMIYKECQEIVEMLKREYALSDRCISCEERLRIEGSELCLTCLLNTKPDAGGVWTDETY